MDGDRFYCEPYRCTMSVSACAARWKAARTKPAKARAAAVDRRSACFGCEVGARHAGEAPEAAGLNEVRDALKVLRAATPTQVLTLIVAEGDPPVRHRMQIWRLMQLLVARGEAVQDARRSDAVRLKSETRPPMPHPLLGDSARRCFKLLQIMGTTGSMSSGLAEVLLKAHNVDGDFEQARKALRQLEAMGHTERAPWDGQKARWILRREDSAA